MFASQTNEPTNQLKLTQRKNINTTRNAFRYDTWFKNDFEHILATEEENKQSAGHQVIYNNQASARTEVLEKLPNLNCYFSSAPKYRQAAKGCRVLIRVVELTQANSQEYLYSTFSLTNKNYPIGKVGQFSFPKTYKIIIIPIIIEAVPVRRSLAEFPSTPAASPQSSWLLTETEWLDLCPKYSFQLLLTQLRASVVSLT